MMDTPFISVICISTYELPILSCPTGVWVVKTNGPCRGASFDPRIYSPGCVAFIRSKQENNGKTVERINVEYSRKNVLLPFIEVC